MKKLFLSLLFIGATMSVNAQYRDVKLPDAPKQTNYRNYEAEDKGFWCAVELEGGSSVMVHEPNMPYVNL